HLAKVFDRIQSAGLKLNPKKCHFAKNKLKFLRYIVNEEDISTDLKKVKITEDQENAFNTLKEKLIMASILVYLDFSREFLLITDASGVILEAILSQKDSQGMSE
ncbi:14220_t:CDS:2, partial [Racocetra persica]